MMKVEIKGVRQLKEKIEKRTGDLITAAIWNGGAVSNATWVGESGPELIVPCPPIDASKVRRMITGEAPIYLECEYCGQLNLLVQERAHKGCGACGGMFNLDLAVEEDDETTRRLNRALIGAPGGAPSKSLYEKFPDYGTPYADAAWAVREFQAALGSSLLPSVKAATEACNKLGRALAGNQAHA